MSKKRMGCLAVVLLAALAIIIVIVAVPARGYEGERITTARQDELHRMADSLRLAGLSEDDPALQALSAEWWAQEEALNIIAKVVRYEADPQWCEWEHSVAVAVVILNRVNSPYFPASVKEVVAAPGQYLEWYTHDFNDTPRL